MDIRVPRLADGVDSGTVVKVLVSEGDIIKKEQGILDLETEKAVASIPSPEAGKVTRIHVKEGAIVTVGQVIVSIASGAAVSQVPALPAPKKILEPPAPAAALAPSGAQSIPYESKSGFPPPASPATRHMARELGVDLARVHGSERGGRITTADVRAYMQCLQQRMVVQPPASGPAATAWIVDAPKSIDFSKWGPVTKQPVSSLRRTIGQKMFESWTTIPHVTQFDEADITAWMELRKKYAKAYEKKGAKLTLTAFLLKAAVGVLKKYPAFNSSLDEASQEIVSKGYYHLGIAVDTPAGLIVPVLKNVDQKSLLEISIELHALADRTRQRKVSLDDLQGGTFTISNLGGIGGTHFTPIVNKPEVAILGVGRGVPKPPRMMLPLSLSYDHRVIDGADGARFMREMILALENFPAAGVKI